MSCVRLWRCTNCIVSLSWGKGERFPYLQHAAVCANLIAPKVTDGICKLLSPTNLSALTSKENRKLATEAESVMLESRELCQALNIPEAIRVKCVGRLDVRCIYLITQKGKEGEGRVLKSISEIVL